MSISLMTLAYTKKLGSPIRKSIIVKLADHASDDGSGIYPSVARIAKCCEVSTRTVFRVLKEFVAEGLLIVVREGGKDGQSTTHYAMAINALTNLESLLDDVVIVSDRGDRESLQGCHTVQTGVTESANRGDTVSPEPSKNHQRTRARAEAREGARALKRSAGRHRAYLITRGSAEWSAWQAHLSEWQKKHINQKDLSEWTVPTRWPSKPQPQAGGAVECHG